MPVPVTRPSPVRVSDDLPLGVDERRHGTLAVLVLGAAADACEWRDAVVDDHSDLRI